MEELSKVLYKLYDEANIQSEDDFMKFFGRVMSEVGCSLKERELNRLCKR